jgi:hypothetical protein
MREIRLSGSEGGVALTPPSLPLSIRPEQLRKLRVRRPKVYGFPQPIAPLRCPLCLLLSAFYLFCFPQPITPPRLPSPPFHRF